MNIIKKYAQKNFIYRYIVLTLVILLLCGCGNNNMDSSDESITITILDPYNDDGTYDMVGEAFNENLAEYRKTHPNVNVVERKMDRADYSANLNSYATMNKGLSDIFILGSANMNDWSKSGKIADVTGAYNESTNKNVYDEATLKPYMVDNKVHAFPLSNNNYSIVVYDIKPWEDAGYNEFPGNYDEIKKASEYFKNNGYECALGFSCDGVYTHLLSNFVKEECGNEWIQRLADKSEEASFVDGEFIKALNDTVMVCKSGVFGESFNESTGTDIIDGFLDEKYPAIIINTADFYKLSEEMKKQNINRYKNLGFSLIPVGINGAERPKSTTRWNSSALVINGDIEENTAKYDACVEFCLFMSGKSNADFYAEKFGFKSFVESDKTYTNSDEVWQRMLDCIYADKKEYDICFSGYYGIASWSISIMLQDNLKNEELSIDELANYMQDSYERYY